MNAWLIERGNGPEYWAGFSDGLRGDFVWTRNSSLAHKFSTSEAAYKVCGTGVRKGEVRIAEHIWEDAAP